MCERARVAAYVQSTKGDYVSMPTFCQFVRCLLARDSGVCLSKICLRRSLQSVEIRCHGRDCLWPQLVFLYPVKIKFKRISAACKGTPRHRLVASSGAPLRKSVSFVRKINNLYCTITVQRLIQCIARCISTNWLFGESGRAVGRQNCRRITKSGWVDRVGT